MNSPTQTATLPKNNEAVAELTLEQLLALARCIRPDILYVTEEKSVGTLYLLSGRYYWAHAPRTAFSGETPEKLLADILASTKTAKEVA